MVSFQGVVAAPVRLDGDVETQWLDVTLEEPEEQVRVGCGRNRSALATGAAAPFG